MKIDLNRVPFEGIEIEEEVSSGQLDIDTAIIRFRGPIKIKAQASLVTNALTVRLFIRGRICAVCSCCAEEFQADLEKQIDLNYSVNKSEPVIDLDPDIREEVLLGYPIKPLCRLDCLGLCAKCGSNLNQGNCNCV
jgi:uncharacterized protein